MLRFGGCTPRPACQISLWLWERHLWEGDALRSASKWGTQRKSMSMLDTKGDNQQRMPKLHASKASLDWFRLMLSDELSEAPRAGPKKLAVCDVARSFVFENWTSQLHGGSKCICGFARALPPELHGAWVQRTQRIALFLQTFLNKWQDIVMGLIMLRHEKQMVCRGSLPK